MTYTTEELKVICDKHGKWLHKEDDGERADLRDADLRDADLHGANFRDANLHGANFQGADLRRADLRDADLRDADLRDANLHGANFQGADLRRADLDYSCFPLWCGGSRFKASPSLAYQLLAHLVSLEIVGADDELKTFLYLAKIEAAKSHRACDLGVTN